MLKPDLGLTGTWASHSPTISSYSNCNFAPRVYFQRRLSHCKERRAVGATRKKILTFGILLVLVGVYLILQGPQILTQVAETLQLAAHYETHAAIIPTTLVRVAPSNYTFLSANLRGNILVKGSLQVADNREIAFYVMNQGNFSLWRQGHPTQVILVSPATLYYNFTLTPKEDAPYFFIFDNHDPSSRVVIFNLTSIGTAITLSPIVQYAAYEAIAIGILLCVAAVRTGRGKNQTERKRPLEKTPEVPAWRCGYCGAENRGDVTFCATCGRSQR